MDGYSYDTAGNLTSDGIHAFAYDAENRLVSETGAGVNVTYSYDALGRRVLKTGNTKECATSDGLIYYLYDFSDRAVVRYPSTGVNGCEDEVYAGGRHLATYAGQLSFSHADWLGTERVRHSYGSTWSETCTSLPFGDNLACNTVGEPGPYTSPLHFTGKEHDFETGLDNFGARLDYSSFGHFMTPDSVSYSNRKNPQSWNLYAYALNNPVSLRDLDGHKIDCANNTEQCQKDAAAATGNAEAAKRVTTETKTHGWWIFKSTETSIKITGDINSFRALSPNASKLADLVTSKDTITVSYDQWAKPSFLANSEKLNGGSTSYTPSQGYDAQAFIDPNRTAGVTYDQDAVDQHIPQANTAEEFGHEVLGHIWGEMFGGAPAGTRGNMRDSIIGEDAVRALDPARGQKGIESHHNYNEMPADNYKPPQ